MDKRLAYSNTNLCYALLIFLFFPVLLFSQTYYFSNFGVKQGLAQSNASGIVQDSSGFYWIGTAGGLSRFDGKNFITYSTDNGLADNNIYSIFLDSKNNIWLGHENGTLTFFDGKEFKEIKSNQLPKDKKIYSFFEDHAGNIWLGTESRGGIKINNPSKSNYSQFNFSVFESKEGLSNQVLSITEDTLNKLWFLTDVGVKFFDESKNKFEFFRPQGVSLGFITSLERDQTKNLLFGSYSGSIIKYCPFKNEFKQILSPTEVSGAFRGGGPCIILNSFQDSQNNIWASVLNIGVIRINLSSGKLTPFSSSNGLSVNKIKNIFEDREGNIVFATTGEGIDVFSGEKFVSFSKKNGLKDNQVWAVCSDDEGNFWFATNEGISIYNSKDKINQIRNIGEKDGLRNESVRCLLNDKRGNIWIGTWGGKVFAYNLKAKRINPMSSLNENVNDFVSCFMLDSRQRLWIGTLEGITIYDLNNSHIKTLRTIDGLSENDISCLYEQSNGNIWIGTKQKGITLYDGKNFRKFNRQTGLSNNGISSFTEDNQHNIWVGTEGGGAMKYDGKIFTTLKTKDGLLSDYITLVNYDQKGNVWFGGNKGLNKLNTKDNTLKSYSQGDGFTGLETKPRAVLNDSEKNIWFGTVNGVYKFSPEQEPKKQLEPILKLIHFSVNLKDYPIETNIELSYSQNSIGFEFVGISLSNPDGISYKIILENYDTDWRTNSSGKESYANLPPGAYTLKLLSCNSSSVCNSNPLIISILIKPPFWRTWWFYLLVISFIGITIFIYITWRERKLQQEKKILEDKVAERTAEVVEKNKELDEKNQDITASIRYAKRIQVAILPPDESVKKSLPNTFVLFRPKDIVSGDFYWMEDKGDTVLFAAVDCTGHGVPGAFMSIVGHNLLDRVLGEQKITEPAKILDELNKSLSYTLRQHDLEDNTVKDGMDITLCSFNKKAGTLQFAGAFNPLWILRNNELIEIKGNKFPIGNTKSGVVNNFTNHEITLQKGDTMYIFTDGYCDQFGGPNGKKFKAAKLREILLTNQHLNMEEQKELLLNSIEDWRGTHEQVDDILVIGTRYV